MTESRSPCKRWLRWLAAFVCAVPASGLAGLLVLGTATGLSAIVPATISAGVVAGLVFYAIARNAIGTLLVVVGVPAALAALLFAMLFLAFRDHSETYPKGPVASIEPLTTFSEFPVYWLGRSYNGLDLTQIHTQTEGPGTLHTVMYLNYGYSVCRSKGLEQRCANTPILLVVEPVSSAPRADCRNQGGSERYLWTTDVLIRAYGDAIPSTQELLRDLSLANASTFPEAKEVGSTAYAQYRNPCANFTPEPTLPVSPPSSPPVSP